MKSDEMSSSNTTPDSLPWSKRTTETILERHPMLSNRWHYEPGVVLLAIQQVWQKSGEQRFFDYIKHNVESFVDPKGDIRTYSLREYNLDQINSGKLLFALFEQTGDEKYALASKLLREQLRSQPRNELGGFWHKLIYPHQMWLDGIYMAAPFYARFGANFGEPEAFDDIALQVALLNQHARDPHTGLFYHAWDASYSMPWADPQTGCSPHFWARAIGWFMMALSDLLDFIPRSHPQFDSLVQVYRECANAVIHTQDPSSGVWYQVIDQGNRSGNYLEASASCMFVYALAKGYRQGFLAPDTIKVVLRAYQGILEQFVQVDERGWVNLHHICSVGGLGGEPYRDGSFDYYISEKIVSNDYKGIGPFIMASLEVEELESHIDQAEVSSP